MKGGFGKRRRPTSGITLQELESRWCHTAVAFESHAMECCVPLSSHSVAVGDLDGDDRTDIVVASWQENTLAWYKHSSGAHLERRQIISSAVAGVNALQVVDLDGDHDLDVVASASALNRLLWFKNLDGHGAFSTPLAIAVGYASPSVLITSDMDRDGDSDLLVASSKQQAVTWFENDHGSFSVAHAVNDRPIGAATAQVADLDGDHDTDIVVASQGDRIIAWYENADGVGRTLVRHLVNHSSAIPLTMASGDLDADGDLDLFSASFDSNQLAWYENIDGHGSFGEERIITTDALGATHVTTADMDGDGDLDVLSTSYFDNRVTWYEQQSKTENSNATEQGAILQRHIISTHVEGARDVAVVDLDRDGDLDLVSAGLTQGRLTWHEQRIVGDVNADQRFDAVDLMQLFAAGEYEDPTTRNATFDEGDWDGDGEFTTADLILAMQAGHYKTA